MAALTPIWKSIGVRLFGLILMVAVPLALFDLYNVSQEKHRLAKEVTGDLQESTHLVVGKMTDLLDASQNLLSTLSVTDELRGGNLQACSRLLRSVAAGYDKYTNFSKVNAQKYIVCSSGPLPKPIDVANSSNISAAFKSGTLTISPFKLGILTGKPILVFSKPIMDAKGDVLGTVNAGLSLKWMGQYLFTIAKKRNAKIVVFDGRGTVLSTYPKGLYPIGSSIDGSALSALAYGPQKGTGQFRNADGDVMLAASSAVPRIPGGAYIAAYVPLKSALAEPRKMLYRRLFVLSLLVVGTLVLGWAVARIILLNPIERLINLSGRLEAGHLDARSGLDHGGGEMGRLAEAFDEMADSLEIRTKALKTNEANYRELVEGGDQLIHRYLPDSTEMFVNKAMADFFGGQPANWVGRKWFDYIDDMIRKDIETLMHGCTVENRTFNFERNIRNVSGEEHWVRWTNTAFFNTQGEITHFQAVGIDLTENKQAEVELERAMMDARAANRVKTNFLANISHELRTPLNSIIGFSEMMTSGTMGRNVQSYCEYAGYISSSGHHLLHLINDLLDLSKVESGTIKLDETEVDMGLMANEVAHMLEDVKFNHANKVFIDVHGDGHGDGKLRINADRLRIKQVVLNVMNNALSYMQNGTVRVEVCNENGAIVMRISDTGDGMSPSDIKTALSPFAQGEDRKLSKRFEGTGFGLFLSERLMEMHDGRLEIESRPGVGTTVTLRFPSARTVQLSGL